MSPGGAPGWGTKSKTVGRVHREGGVGSGERQDSLTLVGCEGVHVDQGPDIGVAVAAFVMTAPP